MYNMIHFQEAKDSSCPSNPVSRPAADGHPFQPNIHGALLIQALLKLEEPHTQKVIDR